MEYIIIDNLVEETNIEGSSFLVWTEGEVKKTKAEDVYDYLLSEVTNMLNILQDLINFYKNYLSYFTFEVFHAVGSSEVNYFDNSKYFLKGGKTYSKELYSKTYDFLSKSFHNQPTSDVINDDYRGPFSPYGKMSHTIFAAGDPGFSNAVFHQVDEANETFIMPNKYRAICYMNKCPVLFSEHEESVCAIVGTYTNPPFQPTEASPKLIEMNIYSPFIFETRLKRARRYQRVLEAIYYHKSNTERLKRELVLNQRVIYDNRDDFASDTNILIYSRVIEMEGGRMFWVNNTEANSNNPWVACAFMYCPRQQETFNLYHFLGALAFEEDLSDPEPEPLGNRKRFGFYDAQNEDIPELVDGFYTESTSENGGILVSTIHVPDF